MKNKNLKNKFQTLKSNHAITLIALIITIVVMLILVAVTLSIALGDNGVVNNVKEAKEEQEIEIEKEKIISNLSVGYYNAYGQDLPDENVEELAKIAVKTGIDSSKMTVYYGLKDEGTGECGAFSMYRYDKTTEEERTTLKEEGLDVLLGDCDLDGFLTTSDYEISKTKNATKEWYYEQGTAKWNLADIKANSRINLDDVIALEKLLRQTKNMSFYHEDWYAIYGY